MFSPVTCTYFNQIFYFVLNNVSFDCIRVAEISDVCGFHYRKHFGHVLSIIDLIAITVLH